MSDKPELLQESDYIRTCPPGVCEVAEGVQCICLAVAIKDYDALRSAYDALNMEAPVTSETLKLLREARTAMANRRYPQELIVRIDAHLANPPIAEQTKRGGGRIMTRESWIVFEIVERKAKTNVWNILTKDGQSKLGKVAWFGRWRRYAFFPDEGTIFEHQCLDDIRSFLVEETADQRRKP